MTCQLKFNPPLIRALLIDISGTLLIGSSPIVGAAQALSTLRTANIPFRLCSNTSRESSDAVHQRMLAAGLDVRREELWTSVGALRAVLKELEVKRPYVLLSKSALEECTDDPGMQERDSLGLASGSDRSSSPPHDAVVVGLAPSLLDYAHLNTAFRILVGENRPQDQKSTSDSSINVHSSVSIQAQAPPRPPLIALHKARYLEASDHALSLGPGPFVYALEDAAQTSAIVVGKPTRAFFETVLRDLDRDLNHNPARGGNGTAPDADAGVGHGRHPPSQPHRWQEIAVIGDDVHADLGEGAVELGLWRVLVKTGKYRPGDEDRKDARPPDQVCASFADFVETMVKQRQSVLMADVRGRVPRVII